MSVTGILDRSEVSKSHLQQATTAKAQACARETVLLTTQCTQSASIIKRARGLLRGLADDELLRVMRDG